MYEMLTVFVFTKEMQVCGRHTIADLGRWGGDGDEERADGN